jgi:hypothetical protein
MGKKVVNESSLTAVADAIRERAGTTEDLVFPEGFVSAVEGIPDLLNMRIRNLELNYYRNDEVTGLAGYAFCQWDQLKNVYLPNCDAISTNAFYATKIPKLDFPKLAEIGGGVFMWSTLDTLIIRTPSVCTLLNTSAFTNSPIGRGAGYVYVPRTLVDSYKAATNWSTYANQIRAIEDYPDITGG